MNIFLHELRSYWKPTIIWALSLSAIAVIFLAMYPAFTNDIAASKNILANLPQALRDVVNLSLSNFFTVAGFYAYLLTYVLLAGAVQATNLGIGIIAKEDITKTAEFLLTKPISRQKIITSKIIAALCLIIITNVIFVTSSFVAAHVVSHEPFDSGIFMILTSTLLLVQIAFLSIGLLLSVLIPKIKSIVSVSLPVVFSLFIIGTIGSVIGTDSARYISPFKYFDSNFIINHGTIEIKFLVVELVLVVVSILACYLIFIKRDIRSVS